MPKSDIKPFIAGKGSSGQARAVICMSGNGSNAEKLLAKASAGNLSYRIVCLFTDAPDNSRTRELGEKYNIPVETLDIRKFYLDHGENDIRLNTPQRRLLRNEWTNEVWKILEPYKCDFAVFAGFVPLTNLSEKLQCLNVHPGDLTVEKDGVRIYAGLHCEPVERAILDEVPLRSSVILVQSYSGNGKKELDGGPVLGISSEIAVDYAGNSPEKLREIKAAREKAPYSDELRKVALANIENLKVSGDHVVLVQVVELFAAGAFGKDNFGNLCFKDTAGGWQKVETVEFFADKPPVPREKKEIKKRSENKLKRFLKYLYTRMIREKGSPDYIARGWSLGMFVGCVVPVFCQLIVAIPLSFVFRGSKIGAALGTFITTPPTAVLIYPVLIWVGNKIIRGNLAPDSAEKLLKIFNDPALSFVQKWDAFADLGAALVAAFFAGGLLWALIMTPLTYFGVRFLVIRYRNMREKLLSRRKTTGKKAL